MHIIYSIGKLTTKDLSGMGNAIIIMIIHYISVKDEHKPHADRCRSSTGSSTVPMGYLTHTQDLKLNFQFKY